MYALLLGIAIFISLLLWLLLKYIILPNPSKFYLPGSHVLITGGSSGIGRAIAEEVYKAGANVTLLARDIDKLNETKKFLLENVKTEFQNDVQVFPVDISREYSVVKDVISQAEKILGPVDVLVNSAGFSVAGKMEDIKIEDFKRLMDLNYFGSLYAARAVIGGMKARSRGRVVFVSSQAGQVGLFGFSGYSASKFALRGLAESLQMEVSPYNVRVCLAFPPDTQTPGYDQEMKTKPLETTLISAESGLFDAPYVARVIVEGMKAGKFNINIGFEGFFLGNVTAGMSPATHLSEAYSQVFSMGLLRAVSIFYLFKFNRIVAGCSIKSR